MNKMIAYPVVFLLGIILAACGPVLTRSDDPHQVPARLRGCVITSDISIDNWKWLDSSPFSTSVQPTPENFNLSLKITSITDGLFKDTGHKFHVFSELDEYTTQVEWRNWDNSYPPLGPGIVSFQPSFLNIGKEMKYACAKQQDADEYASFICYAQAIYDRHVSVLSFSGLSAASDEEIERLINPLLSNINDCVLKAEK